MTRLAMSWLVYRLTNSALLLGVVGFAAQIPAVVLAPIAGVWVDRLNRHRAIIVAQIAAMCASLALAALAFTDTATIWWLIGIAFLQGIISSFEVPARQSFVIQMVDDPADLTNAIALNSSVFNAGRLVGPAIAGILVAATGEAWCFLLDGVSYIAVIGGLLAMRLPKQEIRRTDRRAWHELTEGWRYVVASPALRNVLLLLGFVSLISAPYSVLPPILAAEILHGGANTLGFLMAAAGVGALVAAVSMVLRKTLLGLARLLAVCVGVFGAGCALLGVSRTFWLSVILMGIAGFGMMMQIVGSNTIVQTLTEESKRGRVMSFYTLALFGLPPIGSLLCGALASRVGAEAVFIGSGALAVLGAVWFWTKLPEIRQSARPRLVELGILPEN